MGEKMTKSFDDILDRSVKFGDSQRVCFKKGLEAGQQSKQAEVDELQKRIDGALQFLTRTDITSINIARDILKGGSHES